MPSFTDVAIYYSQQHFLKTHRLIKYLSSGRSGTTFVAIEDEDILRIYEACKTHRSREQLMIDLHDALLVVKFATGLSINNTMGGLRNEVEFLSWDQMRRTDTIRSMITCMIDFHIDGGTQWLTMPYVSGGDLLSLVKHSWKHLSIGFQWHIALQITQLLVCIHFGINDIQTMERPEWWPLQVYDDLHSGNILLRAPSQSVAVPSYPDLVLADFGCAARCVGKVAESVSENDFRKERLYDYRCMGSTIEGILIASKIGKANPLCKHCNCAQFNECCHPECKECVRVARIYGLMPQLTNSENLLWEWARGFSTMPKKNDDELLAFLTEWVRVASGERLVQYQPLDQEVVGILEAKKVGDMELLEAAGLANL